MNDTQTAIAEAARELAEYAHRLGMTKAQWARIPDKLRGVLDVEYTCTQ